MENILFTIQDSLAIITLNRPDKLNAFVRQMALELQMRLDDCKSDSIRAVYITGAGKGFCAGQDLEEVTNTEGPGLSKILSEHFNPIVLKIQQLEKPVVAAVNGVAAGAGANIALCCDIVVASETALFIQAFSKIGLVPDSGGTYFLPRLVGWQKASALMMMGEKVTATEAEKMGMIYKVFADTTFGQDSLSLALTLSRMPTRGLAYTKDLLAKTFTNTLDQQLALEDKLQQLAGATDDFSEGTNAFLEKRPPLFKGS